MSAALLEPMSLEPEDLEFFKSQVKGLTTQRLRLLVSEWAEQKRYLPSELTNKPGRWSNEYTPYLTEIMDSLSASNPARKVAVMKAAQIGATTGILENFIGYTIDHDPSGMIYISADKDLTKLGMELKIDRMIEHSGLRDKIGAPGGRSKRSGDTAQLKEFANGFLLGVGARNPGKLRSTSAKKMVLDELDGMPLILGGIGQEEGSPVGISEKRTDTYRDSRKILYISTPLKMQTSMINPLFLAGDQRHYHIPCRHCGEMQPLEWHGTRPDGKAYGIRFDVDDNGRLVKDSVGYVCKLCQKIFYNHDKAWFLPRGKWIAHSTSDEEGLISFHIPSFLSPPGMYDWTGSVYKWFKAWDVVNDRMKDIDAFQEFYNLERGLPYEERGESPKFERVQAHRRQLYSSGEINNKLVTKETGAPAVLLTCAVDVHKDRLDVEVVAWCRDRQTYQVEWLHLPANADGELPWNRADEGGITLAHLVENGEWIASDGRHYRIEITLIDVGWAEKADEVYQFCQQYSSGVYPVMGRELPAKGSTIKEFQESTSATGNALYNVTATLYKDRLAAWIRADWKADTLQPTGYPNYPNDRGDDFFREYEAEEKVQIIDPRTKQRRGWKWRQIGQRPNHAWDCRLYNMAAFDILVNDYCQNTLELPKLDYVEFFNQATPVRDQYEQWIETPFSSHPDEVAA